MRIDIAPYKIAAHRYLWAIECPLCPETRYALSESQVPVIMEEHLYTYHNEELEDIAG